MKHPTHLPGNHEAEGSPGRHERRELSAATRTSTLPAIQLPVLNEDDSLSETGQVDVNESHVEGTDMAETQDATLTKDETTIITQEPSDESAGDETMTETQDDTRVDAPILIVEDTVELAEVIQATIESMDVEALYVTHGSTGLEKIQELDPRMVIMDIGLPDITGWKMLDSIKRHYEGLDTDMPPIIVITAYGDPANRLIGKLQNIHSYLLKPFTPDQVEKLVSMALRGERPEDPFVSTDNDPFQA